MEKVWDQEKPWVLLGITLNDSEGLLVGKILGKLSKNMMDEMGLSPKEQDLAQELWTGLT